MNIGISITFILFSIVIILLILKILEMKKSIREMEERFTDILKLDTNSLITISSGDKDLRKLGKIINENLKTLRKLEIEYEQGNQELKSSITNISHDLRTPLTAIRGYLDLIDHKNLTKKQKDYLEYIDIKVKDLISLTEQLFDFSKGIDQNKDMKKEDVNLNQVLEEVICSSYELFKKNKVEPKIYITDKPIVKKLNKEMLKRILENILSNAIKYSEENFIIRLKDDEVIEFSNKTTVLDKISAEKIFDRYYTVENAKKSAGIGLSIAKQLVELNQGKIKATYEKSILKITIIFKE